MCQLPWLHLCCYGVCMNVNYLDWFCVPTKHAVVEHIVKKLREQAAQADV